MVRVYLELGLGLGVFFLMVKLTRYDLGLDDLIAALPPTPSLAELRQEKIPHLFLMRKKADALYHIVSIAAGNGSNHSKALTHIQSEVEHLRREVYLAIPEILICRWLNIKGLHVQRVRNEYRTLLEDVAVVMEELCPDKATALQRRL